ncbi:MAG: LacI family DNA-binding transcriptional regulator [Lachnospiraceae bacterium]|nr:LacI family DNA-binding transcriptional regulator [Lachnospiraceae bacterium]
MVTIKDISKACGVSPATVSKALNGYSDISQETIDKVLKAAEKLHYMPNAAARQLKTNSSHNIGVLFVDDTRCGLTHEYFSAILNSAKDELERLGYDVTFISQNIGGRNISFLEHTRYRKCDGVLIASVDFRSKAVLDLVDSEIPTVSIDYVYNNHSSIMSDNIEGQYQLTKYLIDHGHRKIAVIHGERTSVTEKRLVGFYRALKERGIEVPDEYVVEARYHHTHDSARATETLLNLADPPTAIMYPDDYSYLGGRQVLERRGLKVPQDISVTGYDGVNIAQVIHPKLTTYYQNTEEIGRQSARKLVEIIENPKTSLTEQIEVNGKLLEGQSVGDV